MTDNRIKQIEFDHVNHVRLWDWLAKNPDKENKDWPEWSTNGGSINPVKNWCFACEYARQIAGDKHFCLSCPLKFTETPKIYACCQAELMRDMPVRKDVLIK